jgi:predicted DNA-binding helix-hairpin-helix protein
MGIGTIFNYVAAVRCGVHGITFNYADAGRCGLISLLAMLLQVDVDLYHY